MHEQEPDNPVYMFPDDEYTLVFRWQDGNYMTNTEIKADFGADGKLRVQVNGIPMFLSAVDMVAYLEANGIGPVAASAGTASREG